jgi:hypothetical protein
MNRTGILLSLASSPPVAFVWAGYLPADQLAFPPFQIRCRVWIAGAVRCIEAEVKPGFLITYCSNARGRDHQISSARPSRTLFISRATAEEMRTYIERRWVSAFCGPRAKVRQSVLPMLLLYWWFEGMVAFEDGVMLQPPHK